MEHMLEDKLDLNPKSSIRPAKGKLLVAEPFMADPYFKRTVVLMCEHEEAGSMGFVLNRFVDLRLQDLIEGIPPTTTKVGIGGPVGSGELYFLHSLGEQIEGAVHILDKLYMGGEFEQIKDMLVLDPTLVHQFRFFVGYAGWGKNQLNSELESRSWLIANGDRSIIQDTRSTTIWGDTLKSMGSKFAPLANFPEDPSLN